MVFLYKTYKDIFEDLKAMQVTDTSNELSEKELADVLKNTIRIELKATYDWLDTGHGFL